MIYGMYNVFSVARQCHLKPTILPVVFALMMLNLQHLKL